MKEGQAPEEILPHRPTKIFPPSSTEKGGSVKGKRGNELVACRLIARKKGGSEGKKG